VTKKPYHLMTPKERTEQRIAENRAIEYRTAEAVREAAAQNKRKQQRSWKREVSSAVNDIDTMLGNDNSDVAMTIRRMAREVLK
jgi:uncharacterized FlaG/YvyC family protein